MVCRGVSRLAAVLGGVLMLTGILTSQLDSQMPLLRLAGY